MAQVDTHVTAGRAITLDAADEFTPYVEAGEAAGLVNITLEFDGSWSGTLEFRGAALQQAADGTESRVADPILATNLNSNSTATTTTGGTTTTEHWRIDASAFTGGITVYCTARSGGSVAVTFGFAQG